MYIDTSSYTSSTTSTSSSSTSSSSLDRDAFMQLYVTQLEQQDPLDPMDDTEMLAQLAQFSSLEQQEATNTYLEQITSQLGNQNVSSAVSMIGMDVLAAGDEVSVEEGESTSLTYVIPVNAESVTANIYDSSGNIVDTVDLGSHEAGEYSFQWDATNFGGDQASDGIYQIAFTAETSSGQSVAVSSMVEGEVTGVSMDNGSTVLELSDGRSINYTDVYRIVSSSDQDLAA